jgi:hypothetical protein
MDRLALPLLSVCIRFSGVLMMVEQIVMLDLQVVEQVQFTASFGTGLQPDSLVRKTGTTARTRY